MKAIDSPDFPIPTSVYRLQLNADFPLKQAIDILPYLKDLGIEGVYCSPYFKAYSSHGYDITDPNQFNPLIGTLDEFKIFCSTLKKLNLMHIIDVVPNHMGFRGGQNVWWQDVLENGPYSEYALFFDINWNPDKKELKDKVLFPVLARPYGEALKNQEIQLHFQENRFYLTYADYPFPVALHSYPLILENNFDDLKKALGADDSDLFEYRNLCQMYHVYPIAPQERVLKKQEGEERLNKLYQHSPAIKKHIDAQIAIFNGNQNDPPSFTLLDRLLCAQFYRLSYWRVASREINYRRFFNVNELVSIRIEEAKVLEAHHRWVFELAQEGHIQGLRIDHPDGLYDPVHYFQQLRQRVSLFTVVEKIIDRKERIPERWQVEGTVGYEYLNFLNGIFIRQENEKIFTEIYREFIGVDLDFDEIVYRSKRFFTDFEMASEVEDLGLRLDRLSETSFEYRDFTRHDLTRTLAEVIANFPVYRSYIRPIEGVSKRDATYIKVALEKAKKRAAYVDASIFDFLEKFLLLQLTMTFGENTDYRNILLKFQQLTAPIMAKGSEDTAFYIYNRFISLNEVGGDPTHFGFSLSDFHNFNREKNEKWPYAFIATSTHDAKRSEDFRMRLNVLSEMPEQWRLEVKKWSKLNSKHKQEGFPEANIEYYIYQTLCGVWPQEPIKRGEYPLFCERIWQTILKSLREAKQESNWLEPNIHYEEAVRHFIYEILSKKGTNRFLKSFLKFQKNIDRYGAWNSLVQTALKIAMPGVTDVYQGNELLIYQLVDPDNRRVVDFKTRRKILADINNQDPELLFKDQKLSQLKFFIHHKALHFRLENRELFLKGEYTKLEVEGERKIHVVAFQRTWGEKRLIIAALRFFVSLASVEAGETPLMESLWRENRLLLPTDSPHTSFTELFTGRTLYVQNIDNSPALPLDIIFKSLPICYLYQNAL